MNVPVSLGSLLLLAAAAAAQGKDTKAAAVDFEKQIWPILEKRCVECHSTEHVTDGGRKKKPKGGMTLDSRAGIEASKNKTGKLVVAKKPDDSLLYAAITLPADHDDRMPPAKKGEPKRREGKLTLESYDGLLAGGEHGAVVTAEQPELSLLVRVLTGKAEPVMPPEGNEAPNDEEIATLVAWVAAGARGPSGAPPDPANLVTPEIKLLAPARQTLPLRRVF